MKGKVEIAELEAHLSEYVRAAQGGEEIVVQDGDTTVARLVPPAERELPFRIIPASRPSRGSDDMRGVYPTGLTPEEVERLIAETRADSIDEWLDQWLSSRKSTSTPRTRVPTRGEICFVSGHGFSRAENHGERWASASGSLFSGSCQGAKALFLCAPSGTAEAVP